MDNPKQNAASPYLVTPACRLAFPSLFKMRPRIKDSEKMSYQAVLLFPPGTDFKPFLAAINAAMVEKWGKPFSIDKLSDFPIRKCDDLENPPAGYEPGWRYISTHNTRRPGVYDRNNNPIPEADADTVYGGCWVRASLNAWAWTYTSKRGVSFGLNGIQFLRDGEPFVGGGAAVAAKAFAGLGDLSDEQLGLPPVEEKRTDDGGFDFELP